MFHAVKYNDVATVKRLLSRFNYNINFFDKRYKTLLHYAVQYNFVSICKILLEYIDVNTKIYSVTALHHAAIKNNVKCVILLLKAGANPNIFNNKRNNPLMYV
ncbi:MPPV-305 ankyrin repeat protein [Magpiepox virus 2]|nr:MPPV-305 ankyrin repeat protein [Magpiepox virus 2]